jgi:hypothetical protein
MEEQQPMSQTNVNVPGDGSSGMGAGMIVGLVLAIVVLGFIIWYFLLNGGGGGTPSNSSGPLQSVVQSVVQSIAPASS